MNRQKRNTIILIAVLAGLLLIGLLAQYLIVNRPWEKAPEPTSTPQPSATQSVTPSASDQPSASPSPSANLPMGPVAIKPAHAYVQQDGRILYDLPLDQDVEFTLQASEGGYNTIRVSDGAIRVTEADCSDQVCVLAGDAMSDLDIIACLPHRLIIYIEEG